MIDPAELYESLDLEQYGVGIPFSLVCAAIAVFYGAIPGLTSFQSMTGYAKLGLFVMLLTTMLLLIVAGYTYNALDTDIWMKTEENDAVNPLEED